ncbi:actin-binding protein IPP-like [Anneissia japonica]|uniref:actin-binding protein IPP-like n=1 Tax=Anneissia japonica TaxID=1529436 RepID=UPI0014254F13|nr:actin-binding protein IPP-like [Anneissia japonica]
MQLNCNSPQPNQCLSYSAVGHAQDLLKHLYSLRSEKAFCDATIMVGSKMFTAHCVILSACSEYFKLMFCGGLSESFSKQVELHGIDAGIFNNLLEFIYTGLIYLFGGMSAVGTELRTAESFNPVTKETTALADMKSRRLHCSVVVIEDNIYVVGGSNARKGALNSVEQYSISNEKWTTIPCMSTARAGAAAATVNGLLYVVGGRTVNRGLGSAVTFLDTIECYDPRTKNWSDLGKMSVARCEMAIAVL